MTRRASLFGIQIDQLTLAGTVQRALSLIRTGHEDGRARYLATVNVDFMVNAIGSNPRRPRHPELAAALREADLVTADGMPIVWLSRLLGAAFPERVTGADLVPALAAALARENRSVFLLGGRPGIAEKAAEILVSQHPGLRIAGCASPFVDVAGESLADAPARDAAILEAINEAQPDLLLLAFGNPKQELWFRRNRHLLQVPLATGIGGTFEFIAGTVKRAPAWMQRHGLEWLFRISQQPGRLWQRYAKGTFVFAVLAARALATGRADTPASEKIVATTIGRDNSPKATVWSDLPGDLAQLNGDRHLLIDLRKRKRLGPAAAATLAAIASRQSHDRKLVLLARPSLIASARNHYLDHNPNCHFVSDHAAAWEYLAAAGVRSCAARVVDARGIHLQIFGDFDAELAELLSCQNATVSPLPVASVDLSYCRFLDSSALGELVRLNRLLLKNGSRLRLLGCSPIVDQTLRVSQLDQYFDRPTDSRTVAASPAPQPLAA